MYEESNGRVFNGGILSLILKLLLLAIFVFILCWLFTRNNTGTVIRENNSSYANNISTMKEAAFEYFTSDKLPSYIGDSEKLTLEQMLNQKLLIDFTENGKTCDTDDSYVQATKTADENFALKVNLTCDKQSDFIVTTIEKKDLNINVDCAACHEADKNNKEANKDIDTETDNKEKTVDNDDDFDEKEISINNNNPSSSGKVHYQKSNASKSSSSYTTNNSSSQSSTSSNTNGTTGNTTNNSTSNSTANTVYNYVTTVIKTSVQVTYSCSTCEKPEEQKSTVLVKYVDEEGNLIADTITMSGKVGDNYTTNAKAISGYTLKVTPENAKGVYAVNETVVTYVYSKNPDVKISKVIVKYVDESGKEIANSITLNGEVGAVYTTSAKTIEGYTLKTTPSNAKGTYTIDEITVIYVYTKNKAEQGSVTAMYRDMDGNDLADPITTYGEVGTTYKTYAKEFEGYTLRKMPADATGTYKKNGHTVTYYYVKNAEPEEPEEPKTIEYTQIVRYGDWRDGSKSGDGYETKCNNVTNNTYCKLVDKKYYSTTYVASFSKSIYGYTVIFNDINANDVRDNKVTISNRSYFTSLSDYQAWINQNSLTMVNNNASNNVYIKDANAFRNASLTSSNFSYTIGNAYKDGSNYKVDIAINVRNQDVPKYYASNLGFDINFVPVKFDVSYTSNSDCYNSDSSSARSGYTKVGSQHDQSCKYRTVEYKWVKTSELKSYTNNGWESTGKTKTERV